ncbi:MAG: hypothetical protein IK062_02485 [Selenomonadaceae bacterium]|nr:hypothetical protein [Selenomonadaceae bacterium]
MKKVLSMMVLMVALIFAGNCQAEASEVYVGTYSDGNPVYVLTETVGMYPAGAGLYYCTVRAGNAYLKYEFWAESAVWKYKNSEGYHGFVYDGSSPIAANILNYIKQ